MITFNPPLSETTILNVPPHTGHLTFTATVKTGQLDTRSVIQIWSDIPDNSQPCISREQQQDWSPRSFQFQQNPSVASLSIPFLDLIHPSRSQFSFTYRILHPDGSVQWLGDFQRNGSLIVNRYDDRLVLFGDWSTDNLGHVFTPKSATKSPLQVFSLWDKIQWRCWDLSNSAPRLLSPDDGPSHLHSALLVPSQPKAAIVPLSPILLTSKDVQATIHLNARSVYITSSSKGGLLSLQTLSPDALISSLTAALPSVISIPSPDNRHACLIANPDRTPTRLFVIPLSPHSSPSVPSTLSLPLSPFLSHVRFLSNGSFSRFSVSKPRRFISTSADHFQLDILDFGGAHFSLSPVYDLIKPDGDVRLSILSRHNRIPSSASHSLLTPPPSPPLTATETETETDGHELADRVHHVDDQPTEPVLTSGQSTPKLGSGQTTPKPRPAYDSAPNQIRPPEKGGIRKLVYFVLRILTFYTRILARIVLTIFARLFAFKSPKREFVATPKIKTVELDDDQPPVYSAPHTPKVGTPRPQHSGASTPVHSVGQSLPAVAKTLEAITTKIVPDLTAKIGEEEKTREDVAGSHAQEPDFLEEKFNENWEVIHRPRIAFELAALPSPPVTTEGESSPKIKPIRLTLDGAESVVKQIKFYLDEVELTNVKVEPLTEEGLWTVEVPRMTRDLTILRIA